MGFGYENITKRFSSDLNFEKHSHLYSSHMHETALLICSCFYLEENGQSTGAQEYLPGQVVMETHFRELYRQFDHVRAFFAGKDGYYNQTTAI